MIPVSFLQFPCHKCKEAGKNVMMEPYYRGGVAKKKHPDAWICPVKDCGSELLYETFVEAVQKKVIEQKEKEANDLKEKPQAV